MPFVIRKIEPRYVCRGHVPQGGNASDCWPVGAEMEAVANGALTASLKQLASVLATAEDIFADLTAELTSVADRSGLLRRRLDKLEEKLSTIDPKKIPVPESDIGSFATRTEHFRSSNKPNGSLFTNISRPKALRELYEAAAVVAVRSLDSLRRDRDADSSMDMFMCTPVLGKRRRDKSLDIESRVPAALEDLRRWTSTEALGDVTVAPDCMSRILGDTATDDAVDHKLPSPEEQVQAVALKFPAEIVAVDVSGRGFERMSMRRRSLLAGPEDTTAVKRRSRPRRPRGKRRNTIAGTDQKEIRQAVGGESTPDEPEESLAGPSSRAHRSASTDILGSKKDSPLEKKSHFNTLKAWGMSRLKLISPRSSQASSQHIDLCTDGAPNETSDETTIDVQSKTPEETNIYETVSTKRRKDKSHERKPSSSSSSGKSTSSIPVTMPNTEIRQSSVKLRESAAQRRERRKGTSKDDPPHSSSGNWSASSESGRASIGSETTTTTHPPRSTTTASVGTSSTSLYHTRRLKGRDTSASSSVTSEGTLTPDIIQDIAVVPFSDDGETSSVYSCDTEGYYTSFHMDSGLKTLREEEPSPQSPVTKSSEVSSDPTSPVVENEYELFGRGSTSTTTSSAGTVCTTLLAPVPPERKSSLTVVAMVHGQNQNGGESPDSGHNTSSSPVESASSPACTGRSYSEFEYSESSDLEGCDRIERIRSKTAINTSRIPSMCVITPPGSDDEQSKDPEEQDTRRNEKKSDLRSTGSVLMSATVGTSKMEVINGEDKNLYATVQTVLPANPSNTSGHFFKSPSSNQTNSTSSTTSTKTSPLSGVLGKLRGVLPLAGRRHASKNAVQDLPRTAGDSGDYVTIADVRNNNDKRQETAMKTPLPSQATYANADLFKRDAEYVSLSELPKKADSSLERRRQGARVTLDSEGKVVYSSDSLKRQKGAHTTFNPGPFVKEGTSPLPSPLLHRAPTHVRAVTKTSSDQVDGPRQGPSSPPTSPQLGKVIIRAAKSPERAPSPDYVRTPSTVVGPTSPTSPHRQVRGAYVNVQGDEDNALLPFSAVESAPQQVTSQPPPPYVGPPQPCDWQKKRVDYRGNDASQQDFRIYDENRGNYGQAQNNCYNNKATDTGPMENCRKSQSAANNQGGYYEPPNYGDNRSTYSREIVKMENARNQEQSYGPRVDGKQQQFFTLPTRRPVREAEPPRSVTPDITRGLSRGPLSAMHMFARHGRKPITETGQHFQDSNRRRIAEYMEIDGRSAENLRSQQLASDTRNRFMAPLGLSALGYRFFASSPIHEPDKKSTESLRDSAISPIGPANYGTAMQSSTPTARSNATVAERLTLMGNNCPSPIPASSGRSTPTQSTSGRNTPTNLSIISPTRSTMSNEELFAAIHKSKRRLNIKDDSENISPASSMNSLVKAHAGTRHSWSPESQKTPEIPATVQSPSATSRLDFKRLLLQQSVKIGPARLSAAEQLKLSRQQQADQQHPQYQQQMKQQHCQQNPHQPILHQNAPYQAPLASKVLSPRSIWRFQTPRTDVLSSTIMEDAAAEEKAMKPSPENPPPSSRFNSRRQLDLGPKLTSEIPENGTINNEATNMRQNVETLGQTRTNPVPDGKRVCHQRSDNQPISRSALDTQNPATMPALREFNGAPCGLGSGFDVSGLDATPARVTGRSSLESRRVHNQLARAQFLAGLPATNNNNNSTNNNNNNQRQSAYLLEKRFRARSESPQPTAAQSVARSPSAPTLETAL